MDEELKDSLTIQECIKQNKSLDTNQLLDLYNGINEIKDKYDYETDQQIKKFFDLEIRALEFLINNVTKNE